jgi:hypothetical protein
MGPFFFRSKIRTFTTRTSKLRNMKYFNILLAVFALTIACKEGAPKAEVEDQAADSQIGSDSQSEDAADYGKLEGATAELNAVQAGELFKGLSPADTLQTRFRAEVLEVCQAKGCWMRLALPDSQSVMVRFKDYGFFVPKDLAGTEVLVEGKAFISEVAEDERRHLAEDGGATPSELEAIQGAAKELGFEANGVRVFR